METYYRVEVYDYDEEQSVSGFVSILSLIVCMELGLDIETDDKVIAEAISKTDNIRVNELSNLLALFLDNVEKPEVYIKTPLIMCAFIKDRILQIKSASLTFSMISLVILFRIMV